MYAKNAKRIAIDNASKNVDKILELIIETARHGESSLYQDKHKLSKGDIRSLSLLGYIINSAQDKDGYIIDWSQA